MDDDHSRSSLSAVFFFFARVLALVTTESVTWDKPYGRHSKVLLVLRLNWSTSSDHRGAAASVLGYFVSWGLSPRCMAMREVFALILGPTTGHMSLRLGSRSLLGEWKKSFA